MRLFYNNVISTNFLFKYRCLLQLSNLFFKNKTMMKFRTQSRIIADIWWYGWW